METHSLLTIKEFAELCQVHPKSLRYYDSLGILKPCFVNPKNGYRYYSLYQKHLVGAIQHLVEVGIPVKNFNQYLSPQNKEIHWGKIAEDAISMLEEKIDKEQNLLKRLKNLSSDFQFFETVGSDLYSYRFTQEHLCLGVPFDGTRNTPEWESMLKHLLQTIRKHGLEEGLISSILRLKEDGVWKQYLCFPIASLPENDIDGFRTITLPKGHFLCKITDCSGLEHVWDWIPDDIHKENVTLMIESEALLSNYHYPSPILEQAFYLPDMPDIS